MKKLSFLAVLLVVAAFSSSIVFANDINPHVISEWQAGNASEECARLEGHGLGTYSFGVKFESNEVYLNSQKTVSDNTITITYVDPSSGKAKTFIWSSTSGVGAVIVKAGTGANVWVYDPQAYSDSGLYGYDNKEISHITFCWNDYETASVTATPLGCTEGFVQEPVKVDAKGVKVKIYSDSSKEEQYLLKTHDPSMDTNPVTYTDLAPGTYYLGYQLLDGYQWPASELPQSFVVRDCSKSSASASAEVQACEFGDETEPVLISSMGVKVHVYSNSEFKEADLVLTHDPTVKNPETYTGLAAGTYYMKYELLDEEKYEIPEGGLQESFVIAPCEKDSADAYADPLGCTKGIVAEPVEVYGEGVIVYIYSDFEMSNLVLTHDPTEASNNPETYDSLGAGVYYLDYELLPGFAFPEGGLQKTFEILPCETDKGSADASIKLGACTWTIDDGSLIPVTINLSNAKLTLNGKVYEAKTSSSDEKDAAAIPVYTGEYALALAPGEYPYTWESIDPDVYTGSGKGTLITRPCAPEEDKQPDVPSAGSAPSLYKTATPLLLGVMEIGLAWTILKKKFKVNR